MKNQKIWKILNPTLKHHGYVWHGGKNVDPLPFKARGWCLDGGLYFTTFDQLLKYRDVKYKLQDHYIGRIFLADDEDVWHDSVKKWKAHTVTLMNLQKVGDLSDKQYYNLVGQYTMQEAFEPYNKSRQHEQWKRLIDLFDWVKPLVRDHHKVNTNCTSANHDSFDVTPLVHGRHISRPSRYINYVSGDPTDRSRK